MRKLDALFVHPNSAKKVYQELAEKHSGIEPPIWAAMLANHCRACLLYTSPSPRDS